MADTSEMDIIARIIAWMTGKGYATHGDTLDALLNEIDAQARQSERRKRHVYGCSQYLVRQPRG